MTTTNCFEIDFALSDDLTGVGTDYEENEGRVSDVSYSVLTCCHCDANETVTGFVLDNGKYNVRALHRTRVG